MTEKHSRCGLAWSRPRADRGLSRPTNLFLTTIGVCKAKCYPDRLRFGSTKAKHLFLGSTPFSVERNSYSDVAGWLGGWLSHSGIVSKPLNLSENFFDHLKAPSL